MEVEIYPRAAASVGLTCPVRRARRSARRSSLDLEVGRGVHDAPPALKPGEAFAR